MSQKCQMYRCSQGRQLPELFYLDTSVHDVIPYVQKYEIEIMPRRTVHFVTGEYYHLFNRGVNKQPIFSHISDYKRTFSVIGYYLYDRPRLSYSEFTALAQDEREMYLSKLRHSKKIVSLLSYCLMPNHVHFLLRQNEEDGVRNFMRHVLISYAKFFNTKYERTGPLWEGQFKAVRIEDDSQLLHTSRYIHLNPLTSYVVKDGEELLLYPWSSFGEYVEEKDSICETQMILSHFPSRKDYQAFTLDRADYQRRLDLVRHLLIDEK